MNGNLFAHKLAEIIVNPNTQINRKILMKFQNKSGQNVFGKSTKK